MKRILVCAIFLVCMISVAATATETRVLTLGDVNEVVRDDANIWLYPSTIAMYPNMFISEFDGNDFDYLGGNWGLGNYTLGAYFTDNSTYYNGAVGESFDHRIDLIAGMNFADMPLGFRLSFWKDGASYVRTPQDRFNPNWDDSYRRIEFAAGATLLDGKLDGAFEFGMTTWTEERTGFDDTDGDGTYKFYPYERSEPDGNTDYSLRLRYWHEYSEDWTLVPHASISSMKQGAINNYTYTDTGGNWGFYNGFNYQYERSEIILGLGTNFQVSDDVMTVTDFGIAFYSNKSENTWITDPDVDPTVVQEQVYDSSGSALPYFKLGLDGKVLKWLDLRIGASTTWDSGEWTHDSVINPDPGDTSYTEIQKDNGADTDLYLGAGMHWGNLSIDVQMETDFMENGPNFISGENDVLFNRVSMKYMF